MIGGSQGHAPGRLTPVPAGDGWRLRMRGVEDLLISLVLAGLVLLPLAEIVLRKFFQTGISNGGRWF